jgi:hypothetical protein
MTNYEKMVNEFNAIMANNTIPHHIKIHDIQFMFCKAFNRAIYGPIENTRNLKVDPQHYADCELFSKYEDYMNKEIK